MKHAPSVRIKDIARMAGVSVGTVDRVLHNRGRVSTEAYAKVDEVLKTINYKPNLIARTLGKGRRLRIAVLIPDPTHDPYWQEVNLGIKQAEEEWAHYGTIIEARYYVHDGDASLVNVAKEAVKATPDGIVMAPIFQPQALQAISMFTQLKLPYVLFNTNISESSPLSFIGQDLFQSGTVAGQLMSFGKQECDRFVILHIGEDISDSLYLVEKEKGFRNYFEKKRLPEKIESFNLNPDTISFANKMKELLDDHTVKGFFVTTSLGTSIVAETIANYSTRIDIQLIGYDMLERNLNYLKKNIITFLINQNPKRQSLVGINHLANHLLFKRSVPTTDLFPLEIITQQNLDSYLASSIH